jgi:C-terminal processing protease CtpA/Prc
VETRPALDVVEVVSEGPAEQAGLQRGDAIVAFDGSRIETLGPEEAIRLVRAIRPGDRVHVEIDRGGERVEATLSARRMPFTAIATALGAELMRELEPRVDHRLIGAPVPPDRPVPP